MNLSEVEILRDDGSLQVNLGRRCLFVSGSFPKIICLCGSTRFKEAFNTANLQLTLAGYIVLTVGSFTQSDAELKLNEDKKAELDVLHKRKIDLADAVLVLNVDGYVGHSTKSEIDYSHNTGKPLAYACALGRMPEDVSQVVAKLFN
jgi:hypothetical protein